MAMKIDLLPAKIWTPRRVLGAALALAALVLAGLAFWDSGTPPDNSPRTSIALAVLGDSGSHSYQDSLSFPPGSPDRGGAFRTRTFQWTEVLARLRGNELNLGPWVRWGQSNQVAWLRHAIGLHVGRTPRKEDYLYNFAVSGATCQSLMGGRFRRYSQAPRLVALMDHDPGRWRNGVVVIRIGNNDWSAVLDEQARDPRATTVRAAATYCVQQIAAVIRLIHTAHPGTRILVVGTDNGANDPTAHERYRSAGALANIHTAFDDFNAQLRELAGSDARVAFFDLDIWFRNHWGTRGPDGAPAFKAVPIGENLQVTNTVGDEPSNAELADHHAGVVWNALWAQSLVARLSEAFGLPLTPISDKEVERFVTAS
ncbi:SGNH/GDSL hydrolase family protein [Bosea sp. CS1GBMeth4]|uniref:SGNH/GDSL hydrolase family protein n=1 Tax=Bosea sp. CS1GBMeth4 TaxID=1892849 RepID=UPI0016460F05|nr:SGNH/GDSL hydrolase family protein [Bosea sp. CS1GBMeth4]